MLNFLLALFLSLIIYIGGAFRATVVVDNTIPSKLVETARVQGIRRKYRLLNLTLAILSGLFIPILTSGLGRVFQLGYFLIWLLSLVSFISFNLSLFKRALTNLTASLESEKDPNLLIVLKLKKILPYFFLFEFIVFIIILGLLFFLK